MCAYLYIFRLLVRSEWHNYHKLLYTKYSLENDCLEHINALKTTETRMVSCAIATSAFIAYTRQTANETP